MLVCPMVPVLQDFPQCTDQGPAVWYSPTLRGVSPGMEPNQSTPVSALESIYIDARPLSSRHYFH